MLVKIILFLLLLFLNGAIYYIFNNKAQSSRRNYFTVVFVIIFLIIGVIITSYFYHAKIGAKILLFHSLALVVFNLAFPIMMTIVKGNLTTINIKSDDFAVLEKIVDIMGLKVVFVLTIIYQFMSIFILGSLL